MKAMIKNSLILMIGMALGWWLTGKACSVHLANVIQTADEICDERLNDTHHCVSVCIDEWKRLERKGK